jgi:hypothetical protein
MEKNEISIQEVKVFLGLQSGDWVTNEVLSQKLKIPARTVRQKTKKFVDLGLCDVAEVFPGHRYRLSEKADKRNFSYLNRLKLAREIFGL